MNYHAREGTATAEPVDTPHEKDLKRRRLETTSRKDYMSLVTKQTTFIPCLPKFFQQASQTSIR